MWWVIWSLFLDIPAGRFLWRSFRARSYDNYAADVACEYGSQDPGQLLANYRQLADKRIAPPIVGPIAPLTDVLIHTRDIERPLGIPTTLHPEGLRAALDYCCGGRAFGFVPGKRTKDLRFEATDMNWSAGDGGAGVRHGGGDLVGSHQPGLWLLAELSGDGAEMHWATASADSCGAASVCFA